MEPLAAAARALARGGLALIPTDTVAGLAAAPSSLGRLLAAKGGGVRPVAWVFSAPSEVADWWVAHLLPPGGLERVWTLSVTLVIAGEPARPEAGSPASGPMGLGLRLGGPALLRELATAAGTPFLLTSANLSGRPAPAAVEDVAPAIQDAAVAVVPGPAGRGTATPVVAWTERGAVALRGEIPEELAR